MAISFKNLKVGFTLIELVVTIGIFAVLVTSIIFAVNPLKQIDRARDSKRISDIGQIAHGLDLYYEDNNCYIAKNTMNILLQNGGEWNGPTSATIYLKKIPTDRGGYGYQYLTDSTTCPQWAVLLTRLASPQQNTTLCILSSLTSCTPQNYDSNWACVVRGNPDCSVLTSSSLIIATPTPSPAATPTPGPTATPTPTSIPTPTSCPQQNRNYACTGDPLHCNVVPAGTGQYCSSNCGGVCN